ncbi:MAG: EutN/CcmL family microcompartment protein [Acidimicrobiia bacterium]|nr:EutN/CcmL family microcompartment protein [Acidimicrobiia bacterium]
MRIARVVGAATGTAKAEGLAGRKLLVVDIVDAAGKVVQSGEIAVDDLGAGVDDWVVLATGSAARQTGSTRGLPVDAAVIAILDEVVVGGKSIHRSTDKPKRRR